MTADVEIAEMLKRSSALRARMIADQIVARGIPNGPVTEVMAAIPRELFVGPDRSAEAYDDRAVPIGPGQTVSQPFIVAFMTQHLELDRSHRVLEIGTGSGYQAAILSRLAQSVFTVERDAGLSAAAAGRLSRFGTANVRCHVGDGSMGLACEAPFDRIVVTAGCPRIPPPLVEQLAVGGVLILPVGDLETQALMRVRKREIGTEEENLLPCRFVQLLGQFGWRSQS